MDSYIKKELRDQVRNTLIEFLPTTTCECSIEQTSVRITKPNPLIILSLKVETSDGPRFFDVLFKETYGGYKQI